jgi:hypothetical protein
MSDEQTGSPTQSPQASHDRAMLRYRSSVEAARNAEDEYLEAISAPELREDSMKQRRWLVLSASATLLADVFGIRPTKIESLGIDLGGASSEIVIVCCGVATLYFLIEFFTFARRDYSHWRRRARVARRRVLMALTSQRGQSALVPFMLASVSKDTSADIQERMKEYSNEVPAKSIGWWLTEHLRMSSGVVEVIMPMAVAIVALMVMAIRIVH